jgi:hypothetical protein
MNAQGLLADQASSCTITDRRRHPRIPRRLGHGGNHCAAVALARRGEARGHVLAEEREVGGMRAVAHGEITAAVIRVAGIAERAVGAKLISKRSTASTRSRTRCRRSLLTHPAQARRCGLRAPETCVRPVRPGYDPQSPRASVSSCRTQCGRI